MNTPRIIPITADNTSPMVHLEKVETTVLTEDFSGIRGEDTLYNTAVNNALENTLVMLENTLYIDVDYVEISHVK